jgi:hypothetical protein
MSFSAFELLFWAPIPIAMVVGVVIALRNWARNRRR